MSTKAAVAIGVDRTGDLPTLQAAAKGALAFAAWARKEGLDVTQLTDSAGPVTVADIKKAVFDIVNQGTYAQLIIFFAGHGILRGPDNELWLLSGSPADPNEAVNVPGSIWQARNSKLLHIVFVSDACRSAPNTARLNQVTGGTIFPNLSPGQPRPEVDVFFASLPGDPALEAPTPQAVRDYRGLFTEYLLKGLQGQEPSVIEAMGAQHVVPAWRLKPYLEAEVPNAAALISITLSQTPEVRAESHPPNYLAAIAQAPTAPAAPPPVTPPPGQPLSSTLALRQLAHDYGLRQFFGDDAPVPPGLAGLVKDSGFQGDIERILAARGRPSFETRTGFTLVGTTVKRAWVTSTACDVFQENGADQIRIHDSGPPAGAALVRFASGTGMCLAILPGFIGTVVVEQGRVVNVSYAPSRQTNLYLDYAPVEADVDRRRAFAAVASRRGYFRVDRDKAKEFSTYVRTLKSLDPTLGLYAAYGYAQGDQLDGVRSVDRYMRDEPWPVLFDVALLSQTLKPEDLLPPPHVAPFCPLLTQGWALLGAFAALLHPAVRKAAPHLVPSLWTTFTDEGVGILGEAIEKEGLR